MAKIQADYDKLSEVSAQASQQADAVQTALQTATQAVSNLQGGAWVSPAADAFYAEWDQLVAPASKKLIDALQALTQSVNQIATVLSDAEASAQGKFKQQA